ncbi:radical SAM protein [Belnapia sp. F-4-1]|uniref:radical SAM protein n=1 Tax=Belnapia sp. F-4-1 TaxID=1545443 RepID=UPI0005BB4C67|nr:radical SAM protein [Belnapia sp. F-4-1]
MQDILFEHVTPPPQYRPKHADPHAPGLFFTQGLALPAGRAAARLQVLLPPDMPAEAWVEAQLLAAEDGAVLARARWPAAGDPVRLDHLMLDIALAADRRVRLNLHASAMAGRCFLRAVKIQRTGSGPPADWSGTHGRLKHWPLDRLRYVTIGNSGICTASCIHCPTNKPWLPVGRGAVMTDRIFGRLVDGLAGCGLPVEGIGFGLFGDPLLDRQLAARIRWLKAALPGVRVTVSTTAAAFAPRQAEVIEVADSIGIHVESLVPETYEALMAPLRFAEVIPRVERLVTLAGPKAVLALPMHRRNQGEAAAMEAWWRRLGGGGVEHQPFTSRASMREEAMALHLAPVPGACTQDLAFDLVVDSDGQVLNCCNDFARSSDLGSLATAELAAILADRRRERLHRLLRGREWQRLEACRTCLFDDPKATQAAAASSRRLSAADAP